MKRKRVRRWLALVWAINAPLIILASFANPPTDLRSGMSVVMVLVVGVVGSLIADRKPTNPIGWTFVGVFFFSMISQFQSIATDFYLDWTAEGSPVPINTLNFVNVYFEEVLSVTVWFCMLTIPVYYFPTGRLPSPRWRWVTRPVFAALVLWTLSGLFRSDLPAPSLEEFQNPLALPLANSLASVLERIMLLGAGIAPISLVIRFWRSRGVERQQIKWPLFSALIGVIAFTIFFVQGVLLPNHLAISNEFENSVVGQFMLFLETLYVMSFPITIAIAILQYRLYDIDIIIRRTIQYTFITAILALVYYGTVVLTQSLIRALAGQQSQLAIVISTLAIAALFNPLRIRVQHFLDRRFDRSRYDAERTLAAFADFAREQVEPESLTQSLLAAVNTTMKPDSAALWLINRAGDRGQTS